MIPWRTECTLGRDWSVGIASDYGLEGWVIKCRYVETFSLHVQNGHGAHSTGNVTGTVSFPGYSGQILSLTNKLHLVWN